MSKASTTTATAIPSGAAQVAQVSATEPKQSGTATASLVCAIASIPFIFFLGFPNFILGIVALILGIVALCNIGKNPTALKGKGFAMAGIVIGVISNVVRIVLTVVLINSLNN